VCEAGQTQQPHATRNSTEWQNEGKVENVTALQSPLKKW
jgi:hypothetical protein